MGDIITAIDGHHLRSIDDLISYIDLHKSIGDNALLTVNRHGQIMNLNLVLQARPLSLGNATSQESILPWYNFQIKEGMVINPFNVNGI